jgi:hypothetical protein
MKMKFKSVVVSRLPANAMALYPFMLFKSSALKSDALIINHEKIHFKQQQELLIFPFYLLYLLHYLINRLKYRNHHEAYLNICFEREAYANDRDLEYLSKRKLYAWVHFLLA